MPDFYDPAFPVAPVFHPTSGETVQHGSCGMSITDYFAGQAIAALCSNPGARRHHIPELCRLSWEIAREMVRQRSQNHG